jgi:peroxiredoxin Q/BCP
VQASTCRLSRLSPTAAIVDQGDPMQTGDVVPDFELPDETGTPRRLSDLLATGPVVLFFYPAAMTAGCTRESCHFRDLKSEFAAVGGQRVGISADPVDKQRAFSEKHTFDFPLLSDPDRAVAESLGVKRMLRVVGPSRRTTFVIDTDRTILAVLDSQTNMNAHADRALEVLRRRSAPA